jgi:hypothetical protein
VDDQEIEHDVKNQDLMGFVQTLLGATPKAAESKNQSSENTAPPWHIQNKCYDVDDEVETSEAEASIAEEVMIQEMHVLSKDYKKEFETVGEDDEDGYYYYEENTEERARRQASIHLGRGCP